MEGYLYERYGDIIGGRLSEEKAKAWIAEKYPWIDRHSLTRAYAQGMYYAWKG